MEPRTHGDENAVLTNRQCIRRFLWAEEGRVCFGELELA